MRLKAEIPEQQVNEALCIYGVSTHPCNPSVRHMRDLIFGCHRRVAWTVGDRLELISTGSLETGEDGCVTIEVDCPDCPIPDTRETRQGEICPQSKAEIIGGHVTAKIVELVGKSRIALWEALHKAGREAGQDAAPWDEVSGQLSVRLEQDDWIIDYRGIQVEGIHVQTSYGPLEYGMYTCEAEIRGIVRHLRAIHCIWLDGKQMGRAEKSEGMS